jgi:hypothetical protein
MGAEQAATPNLRAGEVAARPYAPSWVNRFNDLLDRLPLPTALLYILIWLIFHAALIALRWRDGTYPPGTFYVPDFVLGSTGFIFVVLVHYLDEWAVRKLTEYRWALRVDDAQFDALRYRLAVLPAAPTALTGAFMVGFAILTLFFVGQSYDFLYLGLTTPSGALQLANFLFSWWAFGALSYHALHQLRVGSHIATHHLEVNLFQLDTLYAFAGLALRTAIGWLVVAYAWALITPNLFRGASAIAVTVVFMQIVAVVTFIVPLIGAHKMLEDRKGALQRDIGERIETVIHDLNTNLETRSADELAKLNTMLSSLTLAEGRVAKTPTWPWRPGTLSWLVTAVLLPLGLWLLQTVIQDIVLR